MPKIASREKWKAEVELEIERLALSVQYVERGAGSKAKRVLVPTDWLDEDGKIVFDVGKRLKGWLKEVVATMKPTWKDRIQYGVVCKSLPTPGYVPIATLKDVLPSRNWKSFAHQAAYDLSGLPEPNVEMILTEKGTSVFAMHYVLSRPITGKCAIYGFAQGVTPEICEEWLNELGEVRGLGDKHSSSESYGTFKLKEFKIIEKKEIAF